MNERKAKNIRGKERERERVRKREKEEGGMKERVREKGIEWGNGKREEKRGFHSLASVTLGGGH